MNTADRIRELAQPLCDEQEVFLWDVRFEKEGSVWYLRVFIDKDGGMDMDGCEAFSRSFGEILDREDPIPQSYVLEVGSPGLGRHLRRAEHFIACIGDEIMVKTIRPVNGEREFVGILMSYDKGVFTIAQSEDEKDRIEFRQTDCAFVKLNDDADLF